MKSTERRDLLILIVMSAFWAAAFFFLKDLRATFTDTGIGFVRFVIVAAGLWALYSVPKIRRSLHMVVPSSPAHFAAGICIGVLLNGPAYMVYYHALGATNGGEANVIGSASPIMLALAGALLLRERLKPVQWVGLGIGLAGAYVVTTHGWRLAGLMDIGARGNLLVVLGMSLETLGRALAKRLVHRYSGTGVVTLTMTGSTLFFLIAGLVLHRPIATAPVTMNAVWMTAYVSVLCGMVIFPAWYWIMERMPIGLMGITVFVQAPSAALIAWLFYAEKLPAAAWQGAILIFVSIWLSTAKTRPGRTGVGEEEPAPA